ncbi:DUF2092 domain-containing protein [Paenarthrobacter sp. NPDC090520]|uniref:DUF2092 domain-containing protein n=1 Tax=Paenarthrobacter sp. NPDC090520 TaxID=3364382 RepID=UPI003808734C
MARIKQRWLPALLVPLVLIAGILVGSIQAGAAPSLPPKTAQDLMAMIANSTVRSLSGTVSQEANLGLPDLSGTSGGPGAGSPLEFLTGTHTARVYLDAPGKARLQILDQLAERDVVVNATDAWYYDSTDNSVVHTALPARPGTGSTPSEIPRPQAATPAALATRFLAAIDSTTEVTVGQSATVAGRSAYSLTLTPRSDGTLVESVSLSVDAETGLPLGVTVRAKGQAEPAFSLAYTDLNLATPDASLFTFTPPPGASVTEKAFPAKPALPVPAVPAPEKTVPAPGTTPANPSSHARPAVTGKGWDAIATLPVGSAPPGLTSNPQLTQLLQPVSGGRALTTSLASVLILDDGRVLAGMVPLDRLESAAAAG